MKYFVVIETTATGYSAYIPDLPGCVATGESHNAVLKAISEAAEFHIESLKQDGILPPQPSTICMIDVGV